MEACFALLDDAATGQSRLYTGHAGTLNCHSAAHWPQLLDDMQAALQRGLHAVAVLSYEVGRCHRFATCGFKNNPAEGTALHLALMLAA